MSGTSSDVSAICAPPTATDERGSARPRDSQGGLDPLLTLDEVAAFLNVSPRTVRRLLARGFPCVRIGRSARFEPQAVVRWVSARREGAQGA